MSPSGRTGGGTNAKGNGSREQKGNKQCQGGLNKRITQYRLIKPWMLGVVGSRVIDHESNAHRRKAIDEEDHLKAEGGNANPLRQDAAATFRGAISVPRSIADVR